MSLPTDIADMKQVRAPEAVAVVNDVANASSELEAAKPQKDDSLKEQLAKRDVAINQPIGGAWRDVRTSLGHFFTNIRHHAIDATPRFIVNNSSNILGAAHVGTEVLMFKSSIPQKALVENPTGPIDYVTRALKRVFSESAAGSKSDIGEMRQAMKGKPIKGFIDYVRDTEAATERAVKANVGKLNEDGQHITRKNLRLGNPWQTRSTLAGLIVWSLSALIPDKREDPEEVERMAVKRETNPLGYVGERLKQAVWFPEWGSHKRQMISLGIAASGVFSLLGSWRNNIKTDTGLAYKFNGGVFATSLFTLSASLPLLLATDDQKGFGGFGALMMGRLTTLPGAIKKKFKGDKIAAAYYTTASAAFQAENLGQALIGGAEKLPDGTIVDYEELKRNAHVEAAKIRSDRKSSVKHVNNDVAPSAVVSNISHDKMAMPERVAQVAEAKEAPVM